MWTRRTRKATDKGTTAIEMAILAPVLFYFLIGLTELSLVIAAQQLLENATYNASRLAKTGYVNTNQSQIDTVKQLLYQEMGSLGQVISVGSISITSVAYNSYTDFQNNTNGTANSLGQADQIVTYTIQYPWKLFTPMIGRLIGPDNGQGGYIYTLTSQMVVRNEPYN